MKQNLEKFGVNFFPFILIPVFLVLLGIAILPHLIAMPVYGQATPQANAWNLQKDASNNLRIFYSTSGTYAFQITPSAQVISGSMQFGNDTGVPGGGYSIRKAANLEFRGGTAGYDFINNNNTASLMTLLNGGNVGIRNTNPSTLLHIGSLFNNSQALISFTSCQPGGCGGHRHWVAGVSNDQAGTNQLAFRIEDSYSPQPGFRILYDSDASGIKVGIGTYSPTVKLDVAGDARVTQTLTAGAINTGIINQDGWTACTFQNGTSNYGSGYDTCAYFKDKNGIVHLKGLMNVPSSGAAWFTLPVGYRPAAAQIFACWSMAGGARCDINAAGAVTSATNGNLWISVSGISFRADQ